MSSSQDSSRACDSASSTQCEQHAAKRLRTLDEKNEMARARMIRFCERQRDDTLKKRDQLTDLIQNFIAPNKGRSRLNRYEHLLLT